MIKEVAIANWHEGPSVELPRNIWRHQPWRFATAVALMSLATIPILLVPKDLHWLGAAALVTACHLAQRLTELGTDKLATESDLALPDDTADPLQELVALSITRDGEPLGQDQGIAEVCDGWFSFTGHRTAFNVCRTDLIENCGDLQRPIAIEAITGALIVRLDDETGVTTIRLEKLDRPEVRKRRSFAADLSSAQSNFTRALFDLPSTTPTDHLTTVRPPTAKRLPDLTSAKPDRKVSLWPATLIGLAGAGGAYLMTHSPDVTTYLGASWAIFAYVATKAGRFNWDKRPSMFGATNRT